MKKFADFSEVKMDENNPKWEQAISRETKLYHREGDLRTPFERDEMRIMHSKGYRRLKHKTQVFLPHKMTTFAQEWSTFSLLLLLPKQLLNSST